MTTLPPSTRGVLEFVESHAGAWAEGAASLGLLPGQVAELAALAAASRGRLAIVNDSRQKAKAATLDFHLGVDAMRVFAQNLVERIRLQAALDGDTVYAAAEIDPPAPSRSHGPPEPPTMVTADPSADGTVTIRWKGSLANATFFTLWRRIGSAGAPVRLASLAAKAFTDTTVPSPALTGAAQLQYFVRAHRAAAASGPSNTTTVSYGAGDGGAVRATSGGEGAGAMKMVA
jgi:hypothetical protein